MPVLQTIEPVLITNIREGVLHYGGCGLGRGTKLRVTVCIQTILITVILTMLKLFGNEHYNLAIRVSCTEYYSGRGGGVHMGSCVTMTISVYPKYDIFILEGSSSSPI